MIICDIIRFFFKDKKEKNIQPEDNFNDFEPPCIWCDIGECKCFQAKNGIPRCDEIQQRYCSGEKTIDIFPDFYVDPEDDYCKGCRKDCDNCDLVIRAEKHFQELFRRKGGVYAQ